MCEQWLQNFRRFSVEEKQACFLSLLITFFKMNRLSFSYRVIADHISHAFLKILLLEFYRTTPNTLTHLTHSIPIPDGNPVLTLLGINSLDYAYD